MAPLMIVDNHNTAHEYHERKLVQMHPSLSSTVDLSGWNYMFATEASSSGFDGISSLEIQHIMGFLNVRDRFAFIRTQKALFMDQALVETPVYTSYCGHCLHCQEKNEHLCEDKDNTQSASFWHALLHHTGREAGLQELHLANCPTFTAATLCGFTPQALQTLQQLRVVDLHGCRGLVGEGLRQLSELCQNLQELHLRDMVVDGIALKQFIDHNHTTLRVIDLQGCHTITGNDIQSLVKCRRLETLSLWGCHNVDNASIATVVQACPRVVRLNLRYCHKVDDALVRVIAESLPQLRDLNLRYCHRLSDQAIEVIANHLIRLQHLNLSQCVKITDAAIIKITTSLKSLKELRLWGCTKLTVASVGAISDGLPSLELVDIRSHSAAEAVIGGSTARELLIQICRATWSQVGDDVGVFTRPLAYAVAA